MMSFWFASFSQQSVRACNLLCEGRYPDLVDAQGVRWAASAFAVVVPPAAPELPLQCGPWHGHLTMRDAQAWSPIGQVAWGTLAEDLRAVVLDAWFRPILDWLQLLIGQDVKIASQASLQSATQSDAVCVRFAQTGSSAALAIVLQLPVDAWAAIGRRPVKAIAFQPSRVPITLKVLLANVTMTIADLRELSPGDFLRLDYAPTDGSDGTSSQPVLLAQGNSKLFLGTYSSGRVVVRQAFMVDKENSEMNPPNSVRSLERLELPVSFQFGSVTVTMAELAKVLLRVGEQEVHRP